MLLFRSEDDLVAWCRRRDAERGATLSIAQTWALAQRWYANRLDPAFHGRDIEAAEAVFTAVGLVGPFWRFTDP